MKCVYGVIKRSDLLRGSGSGSERQRNRGIRIIDNNGVFENERKWNWKL